MRTFLTPAVARVACAVMLLLGVATQPQAQSTTEPPGYPSRPIRFLVPYPPGGGNDLFARLVGQKLSENMGQPVIVENKPGAAGLIAGDTLAKAAPDGYTIMVDQSSIATNALVYRKMPFDVRKDLAPVMWGASLDNAILVSADSPIHSLADLIRMAKASPNKLAYGSTGFGSSQHLAMELLNKQAGMTLLHVPYKGTSAAILAVSAGDIQVFLISVATAQTYVKSGKVRAIATTGSKRSDAMPDVPTVIEAGLPNYTNYNWLGVFTVAGTPAPIVDRLNRELAKAVADPTVKDTLAKQGWTLVSGPPDALRKRVSDEIAQYEKLVRDNGMEIDQP